MFELPPGLVPELVPLAWLVGSWEGSGVVEYAVSDDDVRRHAFRQRIDIVVEPGRPYLQHGARLWLEPEVDDFDARALRPATELDESERAELEVLTSEVGYWRLARPQDAGDIGPGYLPSTAPLTVATADDLEELRVTDGGFEVELTLAHPTGVSELYYGTAEGAKIELASDAVVRPPGARPHTESRRLFGLVGGELFWALDIGALGRPLDTHASARLVRVG